MMVLVMFFSIPFLTNGANPINVGSPTRGSLTPHNAIVIEGNANFTTANGVRSGSGSESDPYIISGWDINPNGPVTCIQISNTTAYFTIEGCVIHHTKKVSQNPTHEEYSHLSGIKFFHVNNGKIVSNSFYDNGGWDIYFGYSEDNVIKDNKINSKSTNNQIEIKYSSRNVIDGNDIDPLVSYKHPEPYYGPPVSADGISILYESMYNRISNNTIRNHYNDGISINNIYCLRNVFDHNIITHNNIGIFGLDSLNLITNNIIRENEWAGIMVDSGMMMDSTICNNDISDNEMNGLYVDGGDLDITDNRIVNNGGPGIYIRGNQNDIWNNLIINNGAEGIYVKGRGQIIESNNISFNGIGIDAVNITDQFMLNDFGKNMVRYNNFIGNGNGSSSQAIDDDKNPGRDMSLIPPRLGPEPNWWYHNHWSDHTIPDENRDGVVDAPYNISGESKVNDSEPRVHPYVINVTGAVFPLRILTSDRISVKAGTEYSVEYKATENPSGSNLTWSMRTNASWLSFSEENVLHGFPSLSEIGVYWVDLSVTDGKVKDTHIFNIYVYETIDPTVGPSGNDTEPKPNGTEPKDNQPPQDGRILLPPGEMHEGDELVFSTFVYDPDLKENESLNYTWYIVGIGIVGYGSQIELTLSKNNYTIIVNVTDPNGATVTIEKAIQVLDKGQVIDPGSGTKSDKAWWESPWIIASIVLLTNLMIIAFFGFVMIFRERTSYEAALSPGSYDPGLRRRNPPKGPIISGPLIYSAEGILSSIVEKGGISLDHDDMNKVRSGAESLYKEGKISRKTYGIIRRNLHGSQKEE